MNTKQRFSEEEIKKIVADYKKYSSGKILLNDKEIDDTLNDYEDNIGNMEEHEKNIATTYIKSNEYIDNFIDRRDKGEAVDYEDPKGKHYLAIIELFENPIKYGYDQNMPILMRKIDLLYKNYQKISKT